MTQYSKRKGKGHSRCALVFNADGLFPLQYPAPLTKTSPPTLESWPLAATIARTYCQLTAPTNFFDLPRELRDQVYYELWECILCIKIHPNIDSNAPNNCDDWAIISACHTVAARRAGRHGKTDGMPLWLLTCKQVLTEAIEEFRFKGVWVVDARTSPDLAGIRSLLSPGEAQRLEFITDEPLNESWLSLSGSSYNPSSEDLNYLTFALQCIEKTGNAKELSIHCLICVDFDGVDVGSELDLAGIDGDALGNCRLTKLTFVLDHCCYNPNAAIKESFSGEVRKLGILARGTDVAPVMEAHREGIKLTVTRPHDAGKDALEKRKMSIQDTGRVEAAQFPRR
jgi:hypothetical protein